ncbi:MAG: neutral/alkaline non-lysosomal ceramidase N-terminal domain-containing protein [Planctomycetota bacterium]
MRILAVTALVCLFLFQASGAAQGKLRVGAAKADISPTQLPVLVNGGMFSRQAEQINTRIHARAVVLDDGSERIGICVVDSCILDRSVCDEAKDLAASKTKLRRERMLISATHTHTAPSSYGALGTDPDPTYTPLLRQKIAEAFEQAEANLQPAKFGWGTQEAANFTALRRWVIRPDRVAQDPFGNPTVRANMHSARDPNNATGPTGPEDPELSMIAFQAMDGSPIAVLANFSMHYFGGQQAISADYFGIYCELLEEFLSGKEDSDVVAVMSHGCSGDIWRNDYMSPKKEASGSVEDFSLGLVEISKQVYRSMEFEADADLAMAEAKLPMRYRVPNAQRLAWAKEVVGAMGDRLPKTQPEVYAREQIILHQRQSTELVLQAIRIGDIAIATTPNETYALTGLKLKLQSPLKKTMVIELANGGEGYIPPPEQHYLGGYNTWAARSAGLEVAAEPKIVAADLQLLEAVAGTDRKQFEIAPGSETERLLKLKPLAYWRMNELRPPVATSSSSAATALYEQGVVFFLEGDDTCEFALPAGGNDSTTATINRAPHFAGGRMRAELAGGQNGELTIMASIWNGMPLDVRDATGWFFSTDYVNTISKAGIHLGLDRQGRLMLKLGDAAAVSGSTVIDRWTWNRVALRLTEDSAEVYLRGQSEPEIQLKRPLGTGIDSWYFGGRSDNIDNWEGKLDEIAIFPIALETEQLFPSQP